MSLFIQAFLIWAAGSSLIVLLVRKFVYKNPMNWLIVLLFITSILLTIHGELWGGFLIPLDVAIWRGIEWFEKRRLRRLLGELNQVICDIKKLLQNRQPKFSAEFRTIIEFEALLVTLERLGTPTQPHRLQRCDVEWYKQRFTEVLQALP